MRIERITLSTFTNILSIIDFTPIIDILPFSNTKKSSRSRETTSHIFMTQEITGWIRSISIKPTDELSLGFAISDAISEASLGLITIEEENFESDIAIFVTFDTDSDGNDFIVDRHIIITVDLHLTYIQQMDNILSKYVRKVSNILQKNKSASGLKRNLVYLPINDLYYLVRGTTYTIHNSEDEVFEYPISRGIFFKDNIVSIYTPDKAKNQIPVQNPPSESSNFPFQSIIYSKVNPNFASSILAIFETTDLDEDKLIFL